MAGTGGTTTYTPMSVLTGTTLLPKPVVKPVVTVRPVTTTSSSSGSASSSSGSSSTGGSSSVKKNTVSGSSSTGGSSSVSKNTISPLQSMMSSSGVQQKIGMPMAAASTGTTQKDIAKAAFMKALAAAAQQNKALPNPTGLSSDEADKLRSQFYTDYYSRTPVPQVNALSSAVNQRIDPALLDYLRGPFPTAPAAPAQQFVNTIPAGMGIDFGQITPGAAPAAPFMPQGVRPGQPSGMPAAPFIPQGVRPGTPAGMPAAPFIPQGVRPGTPAGMPAAPFMAQGVRPGQPSGMPAAPAPSYGALGAERPGVPTSMMRDRNPNMPPDQLNSRGIASRLLDYIAPQRASSETTGGGGFDLMSLLIGQAKGDEYIPENVDPSKVAPVPYNYPRTTQVGTTTIPLQDIVNAVNKQRFAGLPIAPQDQVARSLQQGIGALGGSYDPATGQVTIPNAAGPQALAAKNALLNPDKTAMTPQQYKDALLAKELIGPYIENAKYTPVPPIPNTRPVPPDLTAPDASQTMQRGMFGRGQTGIAAAQPENQIATRPVPTVAVDANGNVLPSNYVSPELTAKYGALSPGTLTPRADPNDWLGRAYQAALATGAGAAEAIASPFAGLGYGAYDAMTGQGNPLNNFVSGANRGTTDVNNFFNPYTSLNPAMANKGNLAGNAALLYSTVLPALGPMRGMTAAGAGIDVAATTVDDLARGAVADALRPAATTVDELAYDAVANAVRPAQEVRGWGFGPINPAATISDPLSVVTPKGPPLAAAPKKPLTPAQIALAASLPVGAFGGGLGITSLLRPTAATSPTTAAAPPASTPMPTLEQEVAAKRNEPPDPSQQLRQQVVNDTLQRLGLPVEGRPLDPFVRGFGNIPIRLGDEDATGSRPVIDDVFQIGTLDKSGAFSRYVAPEAQPSAPAAADTSQEMIGSGPEGDGSYISTADTGAETAPAARENAAPIGFEQQVTASAGANRTPTGAKRFTPAEGQTVGANGYIYEVSGTNAQGKPVYKNVGKVPGYTDAQLYAAANRGTFRDPSNIPQGGTTPKPPSAIRTWARSQLDKYNAEIAKKTAEAKAKGEKYDPVSFMDYLSLAGSAATGNVAGMLMKGGQMMYPQIIEWLANGPSTTGDSNAPMMDGSPSSSSRKKKTDDGTSEDTDGNDAGTGGTKSNKKKKTTTSTSTVTPTGADGGYTMKDFAQYQPYLNPVFPPSSYNPGVSGEWNYFPGSEKAYAQGGAVNAPRLVLGAGGPTEDKIPARIDGVHEAKLSNGEFVITAAAVKGIGGGDMQRGAAELMKLNDMFSSRPDSGRLKVEKVR